jgi:hypothetical protein
MSKTFNTTGPCKPAEHYMLPVLPRLPDVSKLLEKKFYFIIHAPRQSGKTTFLNILTEKINSEGQYYAITCSLATLTNSFDLPEAMSSIVSQINVSLRKSKIEAVRKLAYQFNTLPEMADPDAKVRTMLNSVCCDLDKDLIVFFDEADCLSEDPLITFLSQIRDGYNDRSEDPGSKFPRSLALVGMRNIKDSKTKIRPNEMSRGPASPFNIIKKVLTLANFTGDEIKILYSQHTQATGQVFEPSALERVWYWSEGQPWLVNALADEVITEILNDSHCVPITDALIDQAAEILIKRRDTHIDSLLERLKEKRISRVMDSVFAGTLSDLPFDSDDRRYCLELGLVKEDVNKKLRPANAVYKEVMSRVITDQIQSALDDKIAAMQWTDGQTIFMSKILQEFQKFWRQNSLSFPLRISSLDLISSDSITFDGIDPETLINNPNLSAFLNQIQNLLSRKYDEAAYSFMLMAYLQKVVNGGALVHRQFSEGRGAVDLCVVFKEHQFLVEVKLQGQSTLAESLNQLAGYLDTCGEKEGWLVVFNRSRKKSWKDKIYFRTQEYNKFIINIIGC